MELAQGLIRAGVNRVLVVSVGTLPKKSRTSYEPYACKTNSPSCCGTMHQREAPELLQFQDY